MASARRMEAMPSASWPMATCSEPSSRHARADPGSARSRGAASQSRGRAAREGEVVGLRRVGGAELDERPRVGRVERDRALEQPDRAIERLEGLRAAIEQRRARTPRRPRRRWSPVPASGLGLDRGTQDCDRARGRARPGARRSACRAAVDLRRARQLAGRHVGHRRRDADGVPGALKPPVTSQRAPSSRPARRNRRLAVLAGLLLSVFNFRSGALAR